jgi:hypothetical protein
LEAPFLLAIIQHARILFTQLLHIVLFRLKNIVLISEFTRTIRFSEQNQLKTSYLSHSGTALDLAFDY